MNHYTCKGSLNKTYTHAREAFKKGEKDMARDLCDLGILLVAQERYLRNAQAEDYIENVKVGLWLERFWYFLENNNLLLGDLEI
jgi:hypothetical protein